MALPVVYWDASAVLSALFEDAHSAEALARSREPGVQLLSSLSWAEVHAVVARLRRERVLADLLIDAALDHLARGPWRRARVTPEWGVVGELAGRHALRGADLWHLAAAVTLRDALPEIRVLSFDERLGAAAREEGLG